MTLQTRPALLCEQAPLTAGEGAAPLPGDFTTGTKRRDQHPLGTLNAMGNAEPPKQADLAPALHNRDCLSGGSPACPAALSSCRAVGGGGGS